MWVLFCLFTMLFGSTCKLRIAASPQAAQALDRLETARNTPIQLDAVSDAHRKLLQALTWGVASVAIIVLTQIVTQLPHFSPARWVACGCFALIIPWLAVLGYAVNHHMDPKQSPPTFQQTLNMYAAIYSGLLIFCLGFASLLWSYNPSIAGIFVLSCFVAVRRFLSFAKKRAASAPPPPSAIIRLP